MGTLEGICAEAFMEAPGNVLRKASRTATKIDRETVDRFGIELNMNF